MLKRIIEYIHGFGKRQEDIQDEISALRNEIEELKDLVRGECAAREELEKRREATRRRVQKHRASRNATECNVTTAIERNEEEKEKVPPDPYKEKKEEAKKAGGTTAHAKKPFVKPTIEEIAAYCKERGFDIDAEEFWHYYESKDWVVGKVKMTKWHSAVATWVRMRKNGEIIAHKPTAVASRPAVRQNRFQHADNYIPPGEGFLEQLNAVTGG